MVLPVYPLPDYYLKASRLETAIICLILWAAWVSPFGLTSTHSWGCLQLATGQEGKVQAGLSIVSVALLLALGWGTSVLLHVILTLQQASPAPS